MRPFCSVVWLTHGCSAMPLLIGDALRSAPRRATSLCIRTPQRVAPGRGRVGRTRFFGTWFPGEVRRLSWVAYPSYPVRGHPLPKRRQQSAAETCDCNRQAPPACSSSSALCFFINRCRSSHAGAYQSEAIANSTSPRPPRSPPNPPHGPKYSSGAVSGKQHVSAFPFTVLFRLWNAQTSRPSCLCTAHGRAEGERERSGRDGSQRNA